MHKHEHEQRHNSSDKSTAIHRINGRGGQSDERQPVEHARHTEHVHAQAHSTQQAPYAHKHAPAHDHDSKHKHNAASSFS